MNAQDLIIESVCEKFKDTEATEGGETQLSLRIHSAATETI